MTSAPPLDVPQTDVDDLRDRLRRTRWAPAWPVTGWTAGTDQAELRRLVEYWADGFDWAAQQSSINALPWHRAKVAGTPLSYLRFDAETPGALPLVLTNGWPSTAIELVDLARRLARPSEYGGEATDAFTAIIPVLPGILGAGSRGEHRSWWGNGASP
ncbi:epoxide hydrolase N-terminal domain-containing protein [Cryobacterium sp. PAMC25264]|uniref:epoxide hydrolase N-terminal domain-containing protein n=1 Tax=Cryobacterium sp. PAMC25264 TaxID=2861288 RepID=UPI001C63596F|nr:epoxide hydrolase N-terminal domain-containing protein [Cryobacterium sp. PAMC25264]QYF72340.1 epoxide hydrolase N-terminal domain-containing protein [Cryobacterium sp. PAMC25264]